MKLTFFLPSYFCLSSLVFNFLPISPIYFELESKHFTLKKKLYGLFLWMGFNCLKATATSRRQFTFYHSVPRNSWYSFYQPQKDERLSRPWSHPVVLNMGPLDWESSTLTTCSINYALNSNFISLIHSVCYHFLFQRSCICVDHFYIKSFTKMLNPFCNSFFIQ